ncbi:MAG: rubrerythrin family protein [Clostridiales bacterium 43-6]|nr:MAG: rubrerythrin family protein [Clostridiales bacterium 43-6]
MAIIGNPFVGNVPRTMNNEELVQALRLDIINEYEAIIGYETHAAASTDEKVKKALYDIANEEKSHVGKLEQLVFQLSPQDAQRIDTGKQSILQQQNTIQN